MFRNLSVVCLLASLVAGSGCRLTQPKPYASDPFLKVRPPVVGIPGRETPSIGPDYLPPTRTSPPIDPVPASGDGSLPPMPTIKPTSNPLGEDGPRLLPAPPQPLPLDVPERRPMPPLLP